MNASCSNLRSLAGSKTELTCNDKLQEEFEILFQEGDEPTLSPPTTEERRKEMSSEKIDTARYYRSHPAQKNWSILEIELLGLCGG